MNTTKIGMTLDEMKLAVCEKLGDHVIHPQKYTDEENPYWMFYWREHKRLLHWPTEGLQVCNEAEKLVHNECPETRSRWFIWLNNHEWAGLSATYEQRLEALCRVWFPERF